MSKKVLVTGVSGYVGIHCAAELLKAGYNVKGSIRSESKVNEVKDALGKIVSNLEKFEFAFLDLTKDEGWAESMQGCDYVLHVASPYQAKNPNTEDEMIRPAVDGTLRALVAAQKAKVKRVVVTSSIVAMMGDVKEQCINEESWTNPDSKKISTYMKSKTLAEKAAWDFINNQTGDDKLEMTVVNPGPIYGPSLTQTLDGESLALITKIMGGEIPALMHCNIVMSDVRDVAKISVLAMDKAEAKGKRLIVTTAEAYSYEIMAKIIKENGYAAKEPSIAPSWLLKTLSWFVSDVNSMLPFVDRNVTADNSPTKTIFNWEPYSFKDTILDTCKSIKDIKEAQAKNKV